MCLPRSPLVLVRSPIISLEFRPEGFAQQQVRLFIPQYPFPPFYIPLCPMCILCAGLRCRARAVSCPSASPLASCPTIAPSKRTARRASARSTPPSALPRQPPPRFPPYSQAGLPLPAPAVPLQRRTSAAADRGRLRLRPRRCCLSSLLLQRRGSSWMTGLPWSHALPPLGDDPSRGTSVSSPPCSEEGAESRRARN
jgi:hypothetical protein